MKEVTTVTKEAAEQTIPEPRPVMPEKMLEEPVSMTQTRIMILTVSRFNHSDAAAGLITAKEAEALVAKRFSEGWTLLPGFPVFTGMEDYHEQKDEGVRLMWIFGK